MANLYTKQIEIIQYIQKGISSDEELSEVLKLHKSTIHSYVEDLIQKKLVVNCGTIEIDGQGYEEYLSLSLDAKGIIYLDYLSSSNNTLVSFPASLNDMQNSKIVDCSKAILNFLNQTGQYACDTEIEEVLKIDLDMIRFCLQEMEKEELVKLPQESNFSSDSKSYAVKITNRGKLTVKQQIPFEYNSQAKNQPPIAVNGNFINNIQRDYIENNKSQNHNGNGDNIARDKNINNIHESPELNQTIEDVQALLEKLSQGHNLNNTGEKLAVATEAFETIKQDNSLSERVFSALEKGGTAWLQAKLINPSASFLIAALEDWQKTKQ